MKKYELTQNIKDFYEHTLYQIKALIDIPEKDIKIGDLGGYIESEDNLSHEGSCWVADEARIYGQARIYGDAKVCGNAEIYDNAKVYGDAMVYDYAKIYDYASVYGATSVYGKAHVYSLARVFDFAQVFGQTHVCGRTHVCGTSFLSGGHWPKNPISILGSKHHICQCNTNKIKIGCIIKTFDEWLERFEEIGKENGYTKTEIIEYKIIIDAIININKTR